MEPQCLRPAVKTKIYNSLLQLDNERSANAAKIHGLENELDRMKGQMRALKDRADKEVKSLRLLFYVYASTLVVFSN